jgi:hypothetical protein
MNKPESILVGLAIGVACPLSTFAAGWWTAAALHLYALPLPLGVIVAAALTGLGLGCLLDLIFLPRWVSRFYSANLWLMGAVYVGLGIVATGFCMGVPVGTFALGLVAGVYMGRRERHRAADEAQGKPNLRKAAFAAATVTTALALPIGLLALQSEQEILRWLEGLLGLRRNDLQGGGGLVLIGLLCGLLFVMQYWGSRMAARLAFGTGPGAAGRGYSRQLLISRHPGEPHES